MPTSTDTATTMQHAVAEGAARLAYVSAVSAAGAVLTLAPTALRHAYDAAQNAYGSAICASGVSFDAVHRIAGSANVASADATLDAAYLGPDGARTSDAMLNATMRHERRQYAWSMGPVPASVSAGLAELRAAALRK